MDREQAHNQALAQYDALVEFVINLSRSNRHQKTVPPKPLTANLVDEGNHPEPTAPAQETAMTYSVDEWIMYISNEEGQNFIASGVPLPLEAMQAINSVIKGKGKGKGYQGGGKAGAGKGPRNLSKGFYGDKGKGKDGKSKGKGKPNMANIQCHGCGEYGHYVRDCPQNRGIKSVEEAVWGEYYYDNNRVTLVVTDQPFRGYDQNAHGNQDDTVLNLCKGFGPNGSTMSIKRFKKFQLQIQIGPEGRMVGRSNH